MHLMNIIEELDSIVGLFQGQFEKTSSLFEEDRSQESEDKDKWTQQFENIHNLIAKTLPLLVHFREEYQECKQRLQDYEQAIQQRNQQIQNQLEQITSFKDKIVHLQQQQQTLRDEIATLHESLAEKEQIIQTKEEKNLSLTVQLQEQNAVLNQYLENICLKYKNLEFIVDEEEKKRDKMEQEIQHYRNRETHLNMDLQQTEGKNDHLNTYCLELQRELAQSSKKVLDLEKILYQNREQQRWNEYSQQQIRQTEVWDYEEDIPTDMKLIVLSEQISYHEEKPLIMLESLRNSYENSNDKEPQILCISPENHQKLDHFVSKRKYSNHSSCKIIRKVASNIEISHQKKNIRLQDAQEERQEKKIVLQINDRAETKLRELYQQKTELNKVIIQTQNTQVEESDISVLHEDDRKAGKKTDLHDMDPYYVHYLLTVQSIKIQEDEEGIYGILQIDMKPYYSQLITSRLSITKWGEWIRDKLLSIHEEETAHAH